MKKFLLIVLGAWLFHAASAQTYFNKRVPLHSFASFFHSVLERNGRFYTAGYAVDSINDLGNGFFLGVPGLKFTVWDAQGNILHDTVYQRVDKGGMITESNSLLQLPDHTFLLAANGGDTMGHVKLFLSCWDTTGTLQWLREYDKPMCTGLVNEYWELKDFKPDGYGHWLMLSTIKCVPTGSPPSVTKLLLTKLDSSFNVMWHKSYGDGTFNSMGGRLIVEPGVYTTSGLYTNNNRVQKGFSYQAEIFKTDTAGNEQWHWLSDNTRLTNIANDIIHTKDGGYIYCGQGNGYQVLSQSGEVSTVYWYPWIEKIDANGRSVWHSSLNNSLVVTGLNNQQSALKELPDGSIVAAGAVLGKFNTTDTEGTRNYGSLTKLSAGGDIIWHRRYVANDDSLVHYINDMKRTADGGYVLAGEGDDLYYPYSNPIQQAWLIKVDSNGCASNNDPQCWAVSVPPLPMVKAVSYKVYPNPATDQLQVSFSKDRDREEAFLLMDITGRVVMQATLTGLSGKMSLDIRHLQAGIYLYQITEYSATKASGKIIKE